MWPDDIPLAAPLAGGGIARPLCAIANEVAPATRPTATDDLEVVSTLWVTGGCLSPRQ